MRLLSCATILLATAVPIPASAQISGTALTQIATHDNIQPAGSLRDGVLSLSLWAGAGDWYPEGGAFKPRRVKAFGEEGGPLSIPSPLIRAPTGTIVHVSIRNTLALSLRIHGFCDRLSACEPIAVPAGGRAAVRFALHAAGTFHYWGTTGNYPLTMRDGDDSQLVAKDGSETPAAQRTDRSARQLVSVGETYDFALAPMPPRAVGLWMELRRGNGELLFQWPVRVQ